MLRNFIQAALKSRKRTNRRGRRPSSPGASRANRLLFEPLEPRLLLEGYAALERPTELQYWDATQADNGYNFYGVGGTSYLLDMQGAVVHTWPVGTNPHLLSNGSVLDASTDDPSGFGGFKEVSWDGATVWSYTETRSTYHPHHDFTRIFNPELNAYTTLYIANKDLTYDQLVAAGADPARTPATGAQMDAIVEVDASGTIVWEWSFFDHVVQDYSAAKANYVGTGKTIADYPNKLDINLDGHNLKADWLHCNSLDYNQALDQIVINSVQGEFYVIDHGGTFVAGNPTASIAAAATGAGDFLYRFGDPARYDQGAKPAILEDWTLSTTGNKQLGGAHDVQWIGEGLTGAGHFLIFNNAEYLSEHTSQSYVMEIDPYLDASGIDTGDYVNPPEAGYNTVTSPAVTDKTPKLISKQVVWNYASESNLTLYSQIGCSAQRLPNGNTLITADTEGYIMEVTPGGETVWDDQGGLYFEKVFTISVTLPNQSPVISGTSRNPAAPSATVPVWVTSTVTDDGGVSGVTLTYSTGSGAPTTTTVFTETMTTAELRPWTGTGAVNAWTVTGTLLEQRIGSNYGTGNACGLEYKGGAALNALTAAMLTTTNAINAAGTAGYVEFWVQTLTLTGTDGWTFQLDSGSGYVTRLSELTGSSHGWQQYRYDLANTELVSTLKMRFQFTGGGTTGGVADDDRIDLDQITVSVTSGGATTNTVTMVDDGAHGDGAAGDHVYGGQIPAMANGTTVSYYVTATDNSGLVTTDPATAPTNKYSYTVGAAALTVNVVATSVAENAGAAATTVTISRNTDTTAELTVSLASSDSSEATVPATATIPAGQSSVTVNLAAVDDAIVDGTQTVTITASATGFASGSDALQVTDDDVANHTPTDVLLASDSVPENQPAGTSVGTFSTVDPDAWDTFTYALVPGPGDADNGAFRISGNQLVTAVLLDYELKSTTSIRVRTTDQGGLSFERPLTVQILDVNEEPRVVAPIPNQTAPANRQFRFALAPDTFVDPDAGQRLSYAATQADGSPLPKWLKFDSSTRTFSGRPLVRDVGQISVRVMATDSSSPPLAAWAEFSITVTSHLFPWQNAEQPEDVDGNGLVTPQDVLIVINWINGHGGGPVPTPFPDPVDSPLFFDVYGDNFISSMDVLVVINYLNGRSSFTPQAAKGEGMPAATVRRVTPVRQTEIIGPLRLQDTAVDQTFGREADLSSPADWDELLGVLAQGSTTRTWGAIPSYQIR